MVEHSLQGCQTHQNLGTETLPADTAVREKIHGPVENVECTAAYTGATGDLSLQFSSAYFIFEFLTEMNVFNKMSLIAS